MRNSYHLGLYYSLKNYCHRKSFLYEALAGFAIDLIPSEKTALIFSGNSLRGSILNNQLFSRRAMIK